MTRACALIAILVGMTLPGFALAPVSVEQLQQILEQSKNASDAELASRLSQLQLTERFTSERLERWEAVVPGLRSRRALEGLADRSAFLDLPSSEIPKAPVPGLAEQRRIMGLAASYVSKAIPQLPHFYATRTTTRFMGAPVDAGDAKAAGFGPLYAVRISRSMVTYRDGQETDSPVTVKTKGSRIQEQGLNSWGAFGPILGLVLVDAAENRLAWRHWEQKGGRPVAVFAYSVPREGSHYEVRYCCIASTYGLESNSFQEMSAYHGEIAVDPEKGTILRLTIEADLDPGAPISKASMAVEYGPVDLGGIAYICPSSSVSISVAKTLRQEQDASGRSWPVMGPARMLLNHVEFTQYHVFRADSHILSPSEARNAELAPDATLSNNEAAEAQPSEEDLSDAPATPGQSSKTVGTADAQAPEIITAAATTLPDLSLRPADSGLATEPSGVTFRVTTRLVDVNVVALDKKGRPITHLKPEDFEVYDNGVKQDVRSFTRADSPEQGTSASRVPAAALAPEEQTFSNRGEGDSAAKSATGNTIVLLVDASNLSFHDFAYARQQLIHFLGTLPADQRVALYAMRFHGYQIIEEETTDHSAVATKLAKWVLSAHDVSNAEDEEQRNRQQIETVHSPEDMLSVNGNYTMDTATQYQALDAKLRELGSNPGPDALFILVDVAHHLAALPGHKSLVWVTSDNALADWNKLSMNIEKGAKYIVPAALRAQEAMNNAHVSVYPLDASGLEAAVVDPEMGTQNVILTPTFERPANVEHELEGPEANAGLGMTPYAENRSFGSGGRLQAALEQDIHPVQGVFREVADATGGRAFPRSSNIVGELDGVVDDGHATYLLGFTPGQPADGKYHQITVRLVGHRDAGLRYRTGYQYDKEPNTLKERFAQVVWQPVDASEIAVSARSITDAAGNALRVTVAATDVDMTQQADRWTGKLDIFLVQRDEEALHARVFGQTVGLRLKHETYRRSLSKGLTFDERIDGTRASGSYRVVVVDANSGRIGSVTVPSTALQATR